MKRLESSGDEPRTLREMGIFYSHTWVRVRAQEILWLSQGLTLQQTADESMVHLIASNNGGSVGASLVWPTGSHAPVCLSSLPIFAVKVELAIQQELTDETSGSVQGRATHAA
ncbi:MAG: hypothetical protein V7642_7020 [Burkholderiales bacterium]|jgi:hypothetical protein